MKLTKILKEIKVLGIKPDFSSGIVVRLDTPIKFGDRYETDVVFDIKTYYTWSRVDHPAYLKIKSKEHKVIEDMLYSERIIRDGLSEIERKYKVGDYIIIR